MNELKINHTTAAHCTKKLNFYSSLFYSTSSIFLLVYKGAAGLAPMPVSCTNTCATEFRTEL